MDHQTSCFLKSQIVFLVVQKPLQMVVGAGLFSLSRCSGSVGFGARGRLYLLLAWNHSPGCFHKIEKQRMEMLGQG